MNGVHRDNRTSLGHLLLSAYACDPDNGSEPGVGWQMLVAALEVADHVTVVTRVNNVQRVMAELPSPDDVTVVGHDLGPLWTRAKKKVPFGIQAYYFVWQLSSREVIREVHRRRPVDLVHHATIAVDWMPAGSTVLAATVPHVWGPIGGATNCPRGFRRIVGYRGAATEWARSALGAVGRRLWGRHAARSAGLVVAQNDDVAAVFRPHNPSIAVEPNAFVNTSSLPQRNREAVDEFLIVGVGRLVGWKGWALAIGALTHLPPPYRLEVFGTGSDELRLRRIAQRRGVADRVVWRGWCPRQTIFETVSRARCLLHPSLHDSAPGAVAEALTIGTPVVCLDVGGSAAMVAESGGVRVAPDNETCERALADAVLAPIRPTRIDRWASDRLPGLLQDWYSTACSASRAVV